jgi:hypothetical protein
VGERGLSHLPGAEEGDHREVVEQPVEPLEMAVAGDHLAILP